MFVLAAGVLLSGGCRDSVSGPAPLADPGPAFASSSAALSVLGPGWRTRADAPHACFVSAATDAGPIPYRYDRVVMRFPAGALANDGAVTAFRYRLQGEDGKVYRVLNCVIPDTKQALHHLGKFFGVPTTQPDGVMTTQGCVTDPGGCTIPGIIAIGVPQKKVPTTEEPECSNQDYCWDELTPQAPPGEGGGGGGATTPCTTCGPSTPTLSCAPQAPVRGQPIRCVVTTGDGSAPAVSGWSFQSQVGPVAGPAGGAEWSGPAVAGGTVMAIAGGNNLLFTFQVNARGWTWGKPGDWSFVREDTPACVNRVPGSGVLLGWNAELGGCAGALRVQPDPDKPALGDGFTLATAADGPNAGMHYVASAHFEMNRRWGLNPQILPGAAKLPLSGWQATRCGWRQNFYEFNTCMGVNMAAFLAGAEAHEGMGTRGNNGHEGAARYIALQPGFDPMAAMDSIFNDSNENLLVFQDRVRSEVWNRGDRISSYAANHANVTGNWSGTYWLWDPFGREFVQGALHTF